MGRRRAEGEALRQADLQVLKSAAADGGGESKNRWLADFGKHCRLAYCRVHDAARIIQHDISDLSVGFAQVRAHRADYLDDIPACIGADVAVHSLCLSCMFAAKAKS